MHTVGLLTSTLHAFLSKLQAQELLVSESPRSTVQRKPANHQRAECRLVADNRGHDVLADHPDHDQQEVEANLPGPSSCVAELWKQDEARRPSKSHEYVPALFEKD